MKSVAVMLALLLAGCVTGDPVLYDGQRHVVIYCGNSKEHIAYLQNEIANSKDPYFISTTKNLIWNIKFTCP